MVDIDKLREHVVNGLHAQQRASAGLRDMMMVLRHGGDASKRDVDMIDHLSRKMIDLEMSITRFCK